MTLPPLPPSPLVATMGFDGYHAQDMRSYGQKAQKEALQRVLALIPGGPTMDPLRLKNEILEMLQ